MEDPTPGDILKEFADSIPVTIAGNVLARCCIAFDRLEARPGQDLLATFKAIVDEATGIDLGYRCAMMCGVLELALEGGGPSDRAALFHELADEHDNATFRQMEFQVPLQERHREDAVARFRELREDVLSAPSLRLWQDMWLAENPPHIPTPQKG